MNASGPGSNVRLLIFLTLISTYKGLNQHNYLVYSRCHTRIIEERGSDVHV